MIFIAKGVGAHQSMCQVSTTYFLFVRACGFGFDFWYGKRGKCSGAPGMVKVVFSLDMSGDDLAQKWCHQVVWLEVPRDLHLGYCKHGTK
jgi:hypothetical protein